MTHTPSFITISEGLDFVRRLLETFLIGLGVAAGVSLFVLPMTSRKNVFKALNTYASVLDRLFTAQIAFVQEEKGRKVVRAGAELDQPVNTLLSQNDSKKEVVASTLASLRGLQSKLNADIAYTKLEIAWGKLLPEDLNCIYDHLRFLFLPLAGLSMFPEISQELFKHSSTKHAPDTAKDVEDRISQDSTQEFPWEALMSGLEKRLASTGELTKTGLRVAFEMLEISASRSSTLTMHRGSPDLEKQNDGLARESANPSEVFHRGFLKYKDRRRNLHKIWSSLVFPPGAETSAAMGTGQIRRGHLVREHLLVFLFMEQVQNEVLQAVHGLLTFAETKVSNGSMRRNKLILPGYRQLKVMEIPKSKTRKTAGLNTPASGDARPLIAIDAEHLPQTNFLERSGDRLQIIPRILTSPESVFGFRVALASFTVAILAYLRHTQDFFNAQRLIWAMIVIVIGMKPESGASIFGYFARVVGTVVAVILSVVVWYIVNGHVVGVLVFLYFANVFEVSTVTIPL